MQFNWRVGSISMLLLALVSLPGTGCRRTRGTPVIQFTQVPVASPGGPGRLSTISGRVTGADSGEQIVLYAHSQRWWIQPFADRPFTAISADGTWKATIHLGTEYAVLLVRPGYRPSPVIDNLPGTGGAVAAVATVKGPSDPEEKGVVAGKRLLHFSGYDWEVRQIDGDRNGSPNVYSPNNAWTDEKGFLHLRVTGSPGDWRCSEVIQTRNFGYGTYRFTVRDLSHMEPALALSLVTWDESTPDPPHRELTIEFSRWGDPESKNGQFVVQPYYIPANVSRFEAPAGVVTSSFHWQPGHVDFETKSSGANEQHHTFTSGVPSPGNERVRMHLCGFQYSKVPLAHEGEVVIEKFEYLP
jgi:hypothetical protein